MMIGAVLVLFAGISIVALSAMTPKELVDEWARDPVAGIAANLPSEMLRNLFAPLVAVLAASILVTAANSGLMGISRLAFSMSTHKQMPITLSRIHPRFRTPYIAIIIFCIIAVVLLIPGFFSPDFFAVLGALYVFGSLLSFGLAQSAILTLRIKQPELPRPFKLGWNIEIRGRQLPLVTILAFIGTMTVWLVVVVAQPMSSWVGFGWMALGLVVYYLYNRYQKNKAADQEAVAEAETKDEKPGDNEPASAKNKHKSS